MTARWQIPNTRLYISGFPKAGLHAANLMVAGVLEPEIGYDENWFGTFASGWTTKWINVDLVDRVARSIRPCHYIRGHAGHRDEIARAFYGYGIATVFVYRDLRDVLVSMAHHVISKDDDRFKHPDKARFQALPDFEHVLIACLTGLGEHAGLFERWALYAGWLQCDWAFKLKFEDMIYATKPTARKLLEYIVGMQTEPRVDVEKWKHAPIARTMAANVGKTDKSATFRRGKSGEWRITFTPTVKAMFKERDTEDWLIRLGYARDGDW